MAVTRRLFNTSEDLGITRYWHYDDDTDKAWIETQQDVEGLLDANVKSQNEVAQSGKRWGEWAEVAQIPLAMYAEWMATGQHQDKKFLKKWLNDRDNRKYRTRLGRV